MKNNKPQDLMSLLQNEYLKRKDAINNTGFNIDYSTYPQIVDEAGISHIDYDNLTQEQLDDLELSSSLFAKNKLRADTFNKFLKASELGENGYAPELNIPNVDRESDYRYIQDKLNNRPDCIISDYVTLDFKKHYIDIFGEHVELPDDIKTKSVEEQLEVLKKLYMDTLLKRGYSEDEILNACYSFAENTFGLKDPEMGR